MYGEPRSGIFKHTGGVPEYRKRPRLSAANETGYSLPARDSRPVPGNGTTLVLFLACELAIIINTGAGVCQAPSPGARKARPPCAGSKAVVHWAAQTQGRALP